MGITDCYFGLSAVFSDSNFHTFSLISIDLFLIRAFLVAPSNFNFQAKPMSPVHLRRVWVRNGRASLLGGASISDFVLLTWREFANWSGLDVQF
jgi:hypothetical protein